MIKLISKKTLEDGSHEQIWLMLKLHAEPTSFIFISRHSSEADVDAEVREERAQTVISNLGRYISLEETNSVPKDQLQREAIQRLKDMYGYFQEHRLDIKKNCEFVIALDEQMRLIARPGRQYYYYAIYNQMCKEQIEYEQSLSVI